MTTLSLISTRNKLKQKPSLSVLSKDPSRPRDFKHTYQKPFHVTYISATSDKYVWELEEDVLYCKTDTYSYNKTFVTIFLIHDGEEIELTKREALSYLSAQRIT